MKELLPCCYYPGCIMTYWDHHWSIRWYCHYPGVGLSVGTSSWWLFQLVLLFLRCTIRYFTYQFVLGYPLWWNWGLAVELLKIKAQMPPLFLKTLNPHSSNPASTPTFLMAPYSNLSANHHCFE